MKVKVKIDILLSKGVVSVVVGESANFESEDWHIAIEGAARFF